jgi:hypothetical protein
MVIVIEKIAHLFCPESRLEGTMPTREQMPHLAVSIEGKEC